MRRLRRNWIDELSAQPLWVVRGANVFTSVLLLIVAWGAWQMYGAYRQIDAESLGLLDLVRVSTLNGELTRTARMAAVTGDPDWAAQHAQLSDEMRGVVDRTVALGEEASAADAALRLAEARAQLWTLERQVLDLANRGDTASALTLLSSEEYNEQRHLFSAALGEITSAIHRAQLEEHRLFRSRMVQLGTLALLGTVLVLITWPVVLGFIRRHLTERARAEAALQQSEERFRLVTEGIRDYGIFMLDPAGMVLTWNSGAEAVTGYTRDEVLGRHFSFLYRTEDLARRQPAKELEQAAGTGRFEGEGWRVRKDGGEFWDRQVVTSIRGPGGALVGFSTVMQDLTEAREAEGRARELIREQAARVEAEAAERRIAAILESIDDVFFVLDRDWRFAYVNSAAAEFLGRPREELLGTVIWDAYPALVGTKLADAYRRANVERTPADMEVESVLRPGMWLNVRVFPTSDGISVYEKDITERKRTEEALRQSEERFRHFAENWRAVFWMVSQDFSRTLYVSAVYEEIFGRTRRSFYDDPSSFFEIVHPGDREAVRAAVVSASETPVEVEFRYSGAEGDTRWALARGTPLRDQQGKVYAIAGFTEDISERKAAEAVIRGAQQEAEQANRAKSEFLSRMSHELRTPMNAILGFGQLMEYSELAEEDRESVDQILKAGRHLLALINEVLDISRIEAGRITLSLEPVSATEVIRQTLDLMQVMAEPRSIRLLAEPGDCEGYVWADLQRLKQVLLNLLSNGIKYGREGGTVRVTCGALPDERLRIAVTDDGFGIPAQKLERLFTPFDRLDADHRGIEGTGLGLALSRGLAHAMGGRLGVSSTENVGSTFWVDLPLAAAPDSEPSPAGEAVLTPDEHAREARKILYVEDNLSNLRLVERIFAHQPHVTLLAAMQGGLGLELAREHRPDLILLDLNLPDLSGEEVLQRLRQNADLREVPVLVISADATPGQIQRLLDQGAYAYLTKPFDVKELVEKAREILRADQQ